MRDFVRPKLSIPECKLILCKNGRSYTDEEVEVIREFILCLVEIDYKRFQKSMQEKKENLEL